MMSRSVFLLVLLHFLTGVFGFTKNLTTSGRDVSYEVTLPTPVNLYGEQHQSLFVSFTIFFVVVFVFKVYWLV